jgi:flagellin-specific chaperone FliS
MASSSSYSYMTQSGFEQYKTNEIMTASPERLILFLYDQGIKGCKLEDKELVTKALVELIDSLNFKYSDMASRLFRLYEFALEMIRQDQFAPALKVLSDLRETWIAALSKVKAA